MVTISKEIKIAITAIISVIIIYTGLMFLKGLKIFSNDDVYYVHMNDASGLTPAAQVLARGIKVGYIRSITFNAETQKIVLELQIQRGFGIPKGSTAFTSKEMLGSPKLNLRLGKAADGYLTPGDDMVFEESGDLMSAAADLIPAIQTLMPKLDSILLNVNNLTGNPALNASLNNLEAITGNLITTTTHVNTLLSKDVPQLIARANSTLANTEAFTADLSKVNIAALSYSAESTLKNVNSITSLLDNSLHSKDNSLGMLLNDNNLVLHLDSTVQNASLLLQDLRLHPKRYVHFSLFGKKDK